MPQGDEISWLVRSHEGYLRSNDWYWGLGLISLLGAGLAGFFGNFLLALIILIGGGSIGFLSAREPREHSVRVDGRGVSVDGTMYRFDSLRSFWVSEPEDASAGRQPHLFLTTNGVITPHLSLPLEGVSPGLLRARLARALPEVEQGPHLGEHLAELLGL